MVFGTYFEMFGALTPVKIGYLTPPGPWADMLEIGKMHVIPQSKISAPNHAGTMKFESELLKTWNWDVLSGFFDQPTFFIFSVSVSVV